ncbi:PLP-dependent aminotransferase family protein [Desulfobacter curvatus]|uniref:aminotransferase-like domain-containing protein n=1 Tax=Desulfobacter curvatus TaxID=2290 RepID=UPI000382E62D|nr:PLP-dependent aminotransferase family protein [Desulfobacter curvatus]
MTNWVPSIQKNEHPLYQALADAIEKDIQTGILEPGGRLPTHRDLADLLNINVSTVTRGYAEAERRGMIHARVGCGTFVASDGGGASLTAPEPHTAGMVEMGIVTPLYALDPDIADGLRSLSSQRDITRLLQYAAPPGLPGHRAAGAAWMKRYGLDIDPAGIVITAGGQHALTCCLTALFHPGQRIAVDTLTYPGIKSLAAILGIRLVPVHGDGQGMSPADLDAACRREEISGVYLMPGMNNPTTVFMPPERRDEIAAVIQRYRLFLIEDDPYALMHPLHPTAPVSARVPEQGIFIANVSKAFGAGLRVAFLSAPGPLRAGLSEAVLSTVWMASPITTELACSWIMDGTADATVEAKCKESKRRYAAAAERLSGYVYQGHETGFFIWLHLPKPWSGAALELRAREAGVNLFGSERFSVGHEPVPAAVRLSLSGPATLEDLDKGLDTICRIIEGRLPDMGACL